MDHSYCSSEGKKTALPTRVVIIERDFNEGEPCHIQLTYLWITRDDTCTYDSGNKNNTITSQMSLAKTRSYAQQLHLDNEK